MGIRFEENDSLRDKYKYITVEINPFLYMTQTREALTRAIISRLAERIADWLFDNHLNEISKFIKYEEVEKEVINNLIEKRERMKGPLS